MKPEAKSYHLLGVTRSKAKMFEYSVQAEHHITIPQNPAPSELFTLAIGLLGDLAATINREVILPEHLLEMTKTLQFSAHFFDSYREAKLSDDLDPYLILMGAASYYLCDIPGSASVLANYSEEGWVNLSGEGLESLLLWLLKGDTGTQFSKTGGPFGEYVDGISHRLAQFFQNGTGEDTLHDLAKRLRQAVYDFGTPRQLLLGDVIAAVLIKKLTNAAWSALPRYSGLTPEDWRTALQKKNSVKELWPAQHLLDDGDVLKGKSAIVQMPTSAGKTRAVELILRSAFLSRRASLAIIIAPFRALCAEIKDTLTKAFDSEPIVVAELSSISRIDPVIFETIGQSYVAVLTPEKLVYILRHNTELAARIGLLVFDEGHQFDSGARGITYELLLTSLRLMIPEGTQKVLISAVISNAEAIGEWLNGEANVINGTALIPTLRSVGFASWPNDETGLIEYVNDQDIEQSAFAVPNVIQSVNLGTQGKETKDRIFPDKSDKPPQVSQAIALYLGLKLVRNGGVAIFCGKKNTAVNLCEKAVDIIRRGIGGDLPLAFSNSQEVTRLTDLHVANLGGDAPAAQSAAHGIFAHHGSTPRGIRLAVEYAMRENLVQFVICTNTLAQGVNLPIKYLIVTGVQQNQETIKTRDFQNLMGRAGRAGMHTEGSILFADHAVYDMREDPEEGKHWATAKGLLDPKNPEKSTSSLLSIFDPIKSQYKNIDPISIDILAFVTDYINDQNFANDLVNYIVTRHGQAGFFEDAVRKNIDFRIKLIGAIESFLLSHCDEIEDGFSEENIIRLTEATLAFFLANNKDKENLRALFKLLAQNIATKIPEPERRKIYGRTLIGLHDIRAIKDWTEAHLDNLLTLDATNALDLVWPLFTAQITDKLFIKFDTPEARQVIAQAWINGASFGAILGIIQDGGVKKKWGEQGKKQDFSIEDIVSICEGTFSYQGAMLIGAVCEIIGMLGRDDTATLINHLRLFQKRLKYGLPTQTNIAVYELGFADRVICQDLTTALNLTDHERRFLIMELRQNPDTRRAKALLDKYPDYFKDILMNL